MEKIRQRRARLWKAGAPYENTRGFSEVADNVRVELEAGAALLVPWRTLNLRHCSSKCSAYCRIR